MATGLVAACGSSGGAGTPQAVATPATASDAMSAGTPAPSSAAATPVPAAVSAVPVAASGGVPSSPVACTLITAAEAKAALGEDVAAGRNPGLGENNCVFSGQPSYGIKFVQITVIDPAEFTPNQQSVAGSFTVTPVSGVGDAAYYKKVLLPNTGGESIIDLSVQKGQTTFSIAVVNHSAPDAPIMAAEKTLAMAALGRI
jgi:hypothetical protein